MADYRLLMIDGRAVEVTGIKNVDRGAARFREGARGHATFVAREAGVVGEVVAVEKLPYDPTRHRSYVVEGRKQRGLAHSKAELPRPNALAGAI
jgi:hypothetical protein